jgi:hypothetical protein
MLEGTDIISNNTKNLNDPSFQDQALLGFLKSINVRSILGRNRIWISRGLRILEPLPCKGPIVLEKSELETLWKKGALFARYPSFSRGIPSFRSYIYLVDDKNYDLESLQGNQRKETRRALKKCTVGPISMDLVLEHGIDLIRDTHRRQNRRYDDNVRKSWERYFGAAAVNPLFEAWGAFVDGKLGAFRVDFTYRGGFYGDALFNRAELLKYQVMNALMFVSTREIIRRENVDHVSYGMRHFADSPESRIRFKESMGYRRVITCERVEANPRIKIFLDAGLAHAFRWAARKFVHKRNKAKIMAGLLDTYINQRPGCLRNTLKDGFSDEV